MPLPESNSTLKTHFNVPSVAGESVSLIGSAAKFGGPQRTAAPRILARDDDHLIFTCERLFTMIWKRDTMLNSVNDTSRFITEFSASLSPKRIGLLTLIEVSAGMPSPAARAAMQLQDAGREVAPGQFMRFVFVRGAERVRATAGAHLGF